MTFKELLTPEERISLFLDHVNARTRLRDISLSISNNSGDEKTIDFHFKLNAKMIKTADLKFSPTTELFEVMEKAARKFFDSALYSNSTQSLFWVVP